MKEEQEQEVLNGRKKGYESSSRHRRIGKQQDQENGSWETQQEHKARRGEGMPLEGET